MEQTFYCIINHDDEKVRQRILSLIENQLNVDGYVEYDLSKTDQMRLYGVSIETTSKRKHYEPKPCILVLLHENEANIERVIGDKEKDLYRLNPTTIRYMYGDDKLVQKASIHYWNQKELGGIQYLFENKKIKVAKVA